MREIMSLGFNWIGFLVALILFGPFAGVGQLSDWCGKVNVYLYIILAICFMGYTAFVARKVAPVLNDADERLRETSNLIRKGSDLTSKFKEVVSLVDRQGTPPQAEPCQSDSEVQDPNKTEGGFLMDIGLGKVKKAAEKYAAGKSNAERLKRYCQQLCTNPGLPVRVAETAQETRK